MNSVPDEQVSHHVGKVFPVDREAEFTINELFFSRTDKRGIITTGNSVFYRVSGYTPSDLIGKPHNTIRHPDMPKAVFQYFWETIQSGQPIVAYVKNMAIDGSYYWVLAAAFPMGDGYVSIRLKPTSKVFPVVKELYAELLAAEKRENVKASYNLLFEKLSALGFKSYADFARHALTEEIASRDLQRTRSLGSGMARVFEDAVGKYAHVFETATHVGKINAAVHADVSQILTSYRDVRYAAVNMTAEAERNGKTGHVLATIATTFESWASDVFQAMTTVQGSAEQMIKRFDAMLLSVMIARFQCDMLLFLSNEFEGDPAAARREVEPFFKMAADVFSHALGEIYEVLALIRTLRDRLDALRETLNALAVIQQSSRVETARLDNNNSFVKHIESMGIFIGGVSRALAKLQTNVAKLFDDVEDIQLTIRNVQSKIDGCSRTFCV